MKLDEALKEEALKIAQTGPAQGLDQSVSFDEALMQEAMKMAKDAAASCKVSAAVVSESNQVASRVLSQRHSAAANGLDEALMEEAMTMARTAATSSKASTAAAIECNHVPFPVFAQQPSMVAPVEAKRQEAIQRKVNVQDLGHHINELRARVDAVRQELVRADVLSPVVLASQMPPGNIALSRLPPTNIVTKAADTASTVRRSMEKVKSSPRPPTPALAESSPDSLTAATAKMKSVAAPLNISPPLPNWCKSPDTSGATRFQSR